MKQFGLDERSWFQMAQNRDQWRAACKEGVKKCTEVGQKKDSERRQNFPNAFDPSAQVTHPLVCKTCFKAFQRKQDIAIHKCQTTRSRGST